MAIYLDQPSVVKEACEFKIQHNPDHSDIQHLEKSTFILINIDHINQTCPNHDDVTITGCTFCTKNLPTNCSWTDGIRHVTATNQPWEDSNATQHIINIPLLSHFFTEQTLVSSKAIPNYRMNRR